MKACIINAGIGGWYPKGMDRLKNSLIHHGCSVDILQWKNEWPNGNFDSGNLYNLKASALEVAIERGYTHILWLDCSMWAIKNPQPIFNILIDEPVYVETNGYNCAQECSDRCLSYFGVNRNDAEKMPMCSSGCLGINVSNPIGKRFADEWIIAAKQGVFNGSRERAGQSLDERFLHHRQDQSAASIIINSLGIKMRKLGTHLCYYPGLYGTQETDQTIFFIQGM